MLLEWVCRKTSEKEDKLRELFLVLRNLLQNVFPSVQFNKQLPHTHHSQGIRLGEKEYAQSILSSGNSQHRKRTFLSRRHMEVYADLPILSYSSFPPPLPTLLILLILPPLCHPQHCHLLIYYIIYLFFMTRFTVFLPLPQCMPTRARISV